MKLAAVAVLLCALAHCVLGECAARLLLSLSPIVPQLHAVERPPPSRARLSVLTDLSGPAPSQTSRLLVGAARRVSRTLHEARLEATTRRGRMLPERRPPPRRVDVPPAISRESTPDVACAATSCLISRRSSRPCQHRALSHPPVTLGRTPSALRLDGARGRNMTGSFRFRWTEHGQG